MVGTSSPPAGPLDKPGDGEQRRIGDRPPSSAARLIDPPVEAVEPLVDLGVESSPVGTARPSSPATRGRDRAPLGTCGWSGCAPGPGSRPRVAAGWCTAGRSCGRARRPRRGGRGCRGPHPAGVHVDQRGGVGGVDQWPRRTGGVHQCVVAEQLGLVGGLAQQPRHLARSAASSTASITGRYCSAATAKKSGTPASRRARASCSVRRRGGSSPPGSPRTRSWRNRIASRTPGSATSRPSSRAGPSAAPPRRAAGGGGLQQAQLDPAAQACHHLQQLPRARGHGLDPRRQQPGHLGPARCARNAARPSASRRPSRVSTPSFRSELSSSTVS